MTRNEIKGAYHNYLTLPSIQGNTSSSRYGETACRGGDLELKAILGGDRRRSVAGNIESSLSIWVPEFGCADEVVVSVIGRRSNTIKLGDI
jgi:hypothetical protein